jgi:hypothetical protein
MFTIIFLYPPAHKNTCTKYIDSTVFAEHAIHTVGSYGHQTLIRGEFTKDELDWLFSMFKNNPIFTDFRIRRRKD